MAQRGAWTPDKVRQRIQASMLIRRLTDHVLGRQEMSATQVRAAEVLLRKSVPDLAQVDATLHGDANAPIALQLIGSDIHG